MPLGFLLPACLAKVQMNLSVYVFQADRGVAAVRQCDGKLLRRTIGKDTFESENKMWSDRVPGSGLTKRL